MAEVSGIPNFISSAPCQRDSSSGPLFALLLVAAACAAGGCKNPAPGTGDAGRSLTTDDGGPAADGGGNGRADGGADGGANGGGDGGAGGGVDSGAGGDGGAGGGVDSGGRPTDAGGGSLDAGVINPAPDAAVSLIGPLGILSDSNSDEYRADDNRGGSYAATTLNWVELLVRYRGLDVGEWGARPEPRRSGFEYNWARSGATAASLLSAGQHTGLAAQIRTGNVGLVFIHIGDNDWDRDDVDDIYSGSTSDAALAAKVSNFVADVTTAVDTVLAAGDVPVVLTDVNDFLSSPGVAAAYPDASQRARFSNAIVSVNDQLRALATDRGLALVQLSLFADAVVSSLDAMGRLEIGGELFDLFTFGDEPHHLRLNDSSGHIGTVGSALFANALFIAPVNEALGAGLVPFSEEEMLEVSGIR